MKKAKDLIFTLSQKTAMSGFEYRLSEELHQIFCAYTDEIYHDVLGNVRAVIRCGKKDAKRLLLDAHIDEVGLMVTKIEKGGFLRFCNVGGVDERILPAAPVTVHGKKELFGVVCSKPPHIQTDDEQKKAVPIDEMLIDIGFDEEKAKKHVQIGDMITLRAKPVALKNQVIAGKSFDDRAGLCAVLEGVNQCGLDRLNIDLEIMASAQEETGMRGAATGGYLSGADFALVVDVSHANTPDAPPDKTYEFGGGVMIGVGPNLDRTMTNDLIEFAENEKIPYQLEVMGGSTGTNAWVLQIAGKGIPCGLLSIPMRYMHTSIETISMKDFSATAGLIGAYIRQISDREGKANG